MSRVVTISLSPQGGAYTRALKTAKSLFPSIPVGGEVDTNDWCIIIKRHQLRNTTSDATNIICLLVENKFVDHGDKVLPY